MVAALRKQTTTIPIVFVQVSDPVGDGFVKTLARPDSNATGFTNTISSLGGKWAELLKEAAPGVSRVGSLYNKAASTRGWRLLSGALSIRCRGAWTAGRPLELQNADEIDTAIASFSAAGGDGMVANSDSFITVNRDRIIAAANRLRLPTIYSSADRTKRGGLISYGADTEQQWQGAASYVSRILRGQKPSDLPVQQPTKFILSINLKIAKEIGLDTPWFLQQRADEVIE
jgi:putative ABC transport system substrate-binding protein